MFVDRISLNIVLVVGLFIVIGKMSGIFSRTCSNSENRSPTLGRRRNLSINVLFFLRNLSRINLSKSSARTNSTR